MDQQLLAEAVGEPEPIEAAPLGAEPIDAGPIEAELPAAPGGRVGLRKAVANSTGCERAGLHLSAIRRTASWACAPAALVHFLGACQTVFLWLYHPATVRPPCAAELPGVEEAAAPAGLHELGEGPGPAAALVGAEILPVQRSPEVAEAEAQVPAAEQAEQEAAGAGAAPTDAGIVEVSAGEAGAEGPGEQAVLPTFVEEPWEGKEGGSQEGAEGAGPAAATEPAAAEEPTEEVPGGELWACFVLWHPDVLAKPGPAACYPATGCCTSGAVSSWLVASCCCRLLSCALRAALHSRA